MTKGSRHQPPDASLDREVVSTAQSGVGRPHQGVADPALDPAIVGELEQVIGSGDAILFTGAGFSLGARDTAGDPLPDSETMRRELHAVLFGDGPPDDSTLPDLYDVALARAPEELERYLARRLRIGELCDIERYVEWFALPWRRIYTLNVDDLETALGRLARAAPALRSISATRGDRGQSADGLAVVHLNGDVRDGAATLTFSTPQYAARLCGQDPLYRDLIDDLDRWPFVFVGTTLDEVVLWQHLELRRRRGASRYGTAVISSPAPCHAHATCCWRISAWSGWRRPSKSSGRTCAMDGAVRRRVVAGDARFSRAACAAPASAP